ncbi:hypothetical protein L7F22_000350 [Adiantum nelumboides]|nr:hypothetical protein [Adiantum nelumboides]
MGRMMQHSSPSISLLCRNARLSLQKAALSRSSHLLSEELEHLRDFDSLVSETLPLHPHFSVKRERKELLELDSHLLDVRKRLAEIESKHPFLYKHHRKGGSRFLGSNSKSKLSEESLESYKPQKKKTLSSLPHRPPSCSSSSASSSAYKKGLPASFSQHGRQSPPTPSKRSLSASCSRSPSLRSCSSGSIGMKNLKRSLELRSSLGSVVDDVVLPSEKLKLPAGSTGYNENDFRFPSPKHWPKYADDAKSSRSLDLCEEKSAAFTCFPRLKFESVSSLEERNLKSSLGAHVNEAGFLSRKAKLSSSQNHVKCRTSLQSNEEAISSPRAPTGNGHLSRQACSLDRGGDNGKALKEGLESPHSDLSDNPDLLDSTFFYEKKSKQRSRNLAGGLFSQRRHDDSVDNCTKCNDDLSLLDLASETIHGMRAASRSPQKRLIRWRTKGAGRRRDQVKVMHGSLDKVHFMNEGNDSSKYIHDTTRKIARGLERSKLETKRTSAGLVFTKNLQEALKRLGSLQESDGSMEDTEIFGIEDTSSSCEPYSLDVGSKMEGFKTAAAEQSSYAGTGSRRALFGKDRSVGVQGLYFRDNGIWAENAEDDKTNFRMGEHRSSEREDIALQSRDEDEFRFDIKSGKNVPHAENLGSSSMKAEHKKRVKFEKWAADPELNDLTTSNSGSFVEQAQPEFDGNNLNGRCFGVESCHALDHQAKSFVGAENYSEQFEGEVVEEVVDHKPPFTGYLVSHSQDILSSSFSSSASCATAPSLHCSLGGNSFVWDSSKNTTSSFVSSELDAQSHQRQNSSFNGQQFTFSNPVFDFDSSNACSKSIIRSRLDPCDTNGDAVSPSDVASQRNSYGKEGLEIGSDGFLADAHTNRRLPSSIAEPKVRSEGPSHEPVSDISDDERKSLLQVSELTKRIESFQSMLNELKETVQSSSCHVQEQVNICEAKVKGMERQLDNVKSETNSELLGLRNLVKAQLDMKVQKGGSKRDCDGDFAFKDRMQVDTDECSSIFDAFQMRVESWMSKIQIELQSQVEDAVASSMEKFGSSIRSDMKKLELQRLRDLGSLKKEMALKLSLHESKEQLNKISEKQLDLIVEDVLGKQFSHLVEMFSAEKENELAQIKSEVAYLRKEYEAHFRGRRVEEEHAETVTHVKRQLHSLRTDGQQVKFLVDGMKKETEAHVHDIRLSINKLKVEALECRERIFGLEGLFNVNQPSDPRNMVQSLYEVRTSRSPT